MRPMLATPAAALPSGPDWAHEVKWDGMRLLVDIHDGRLTLSSRNGNDVTASFPELAGLAHTYADVLLDGEVVALEDGLPSFAALAERMHVKDPRKAQRLAARRPVTLMVFDVLRLFGQDVTGLPWTGRRDLLERLDLRGPSWQVPQAYADGAQLLEATLEQGLEGIVSKRRAAAYAEGRRSPDWRKMSHRLTLSAVIGGWRAEIGNDARLGAVLLGLPHPHGWAYAGRMGSGLAGRAATRVADLLAPLTRPTAPFFDEVPAPDCRGTTWVEPTIVVEVRALGTTGTGRLRHPTFLGVRSDLTAADLGEGPAMRGASRGG